MTYVFRGRYIPDLYYLYDLAHVGGSEPYNSARSRTRFLGWICTTVHKSCTTCYNERLRCVDDISVDDIPVDDISADDISADDISADDISVDDLSVDDLSVHDTYVEDLSDV